MFFDRQKFGKRWVNFRSLFAFATPPVTLLLLLLLLLLMMMMMTLTLTQVSAGFQSNQQLQCQMQAEKSQCACSVRELEARLLDLQDRLMQKVQEVARAREVQAGLRNEIESYKALIECQEKKCV